jgi:hypothetical protein
MKQNKLLLIGGIASFGLSFIISHYFIQFTVLGVLLLVFHMINRNSYEVSELKKTIEKHNELIKQDIDLLKKNE